MLRLLIVVLIGFVLATVIGVVCRAFGGAAGVPEGLLAAVLIAILVGVPVSLYSLTIYRPGREIPENALKSTIEQYVRLAELFKQQTKEALRREPLCVYSVGFQRRPTLRGAAVCRCRLIIL